VILSRFIPMLALFVPLAKFRVPVKNDVEATA
jgi:hypothetical protein